MLAGCIDGVQQDLDFRFWYRCDRWSRCWSYPIALLACGRVGWPGTSRKNPIATDVAMLVAAYTTSKEQPLSADEQARATEPLEAIGQGAPWPARPSMRQRS